MRLEKTADRAQGRWHGILREIGLPEKALRNRHGPCPMCGGKDRFRFDDKDGNGTWFCNNQLCGNGKGIALVMKFLGVDFKEACKRIDEIIGNIPIMPTKSGQHPNDAHKREEMAALWKRSKPIDERDAAGLYLTARTGLVIYPPMLRFAADERYVEDGARPTWHPVMVAKVEPSDVAAAAGETAAIHRTYLDGRGGKAEVPQARKMLGTMPTGAAVRLMEHDEVLGIAEGIETALSAALLFRVPVWAALNSSLLQDWNPPANVETVFVFGDNDPKYGGQAAAMALGHRLAVDQRRKLHVNVEIPAVLGQDWNDVLLNRRMAA